MRLPRLVPGGTGVDVVTSDVVIRFPELKMVVGGRVCLVEVEVVGVGVVVVVEVVGVTGILVLVGGNRVPVLVLGVGVGLVEFPCALTETSNNANASRRKPTRVVVSMRQARRGANLRD